MNATNLDPKNLLESLLDKLGFDVTIEEKEKDDSKILDIQAPDDSGRLIGRKGQTLFDLQYILNRMLFQNNENAEKVQIDVGGYRFDEEDKLAEKARKAAEQVRRWGDIVELERCNPRGKVIAADCFLQFLLELAPFVFGHYALVHDRQFHTNRQ